MTWARSVRTRALAAIVPSHSASERQATEMSRLAAGRGAAREQRRIARVARDVLEVDLAVRAAGEERAGAGEDQLVAQVADAAHEGQVGRVADRQQDLATARLDSRDVRRGKLFAWVSRAR